jgi:ketoreductase
MNTWLITGASSGIGASLARLVARQGATVYLAARREQELAAVAADVTAAGGTAVVFPCDLQQAESTERLVRDVIERGVPDVVIHNAGRGNCASIEDTTDDQWQAMMTLNVESIFRITRGLLPAFRARNSGTFVMIASVAGRMAFPFNAAYVTAKHAVIGFTAALRTECAGTNIHATAVCPAGVLTPWAAVTDGGSIGEIFGGGIPRSRAYAQELGTDLAPLTPMMEADDVARIIVDTVAAGRSNDVYTHPGTHEQAVLAAENRMALEDMFLPLYLGMRDAYAERSSS